MVFLKKALADFLGHERKTALYYDMAVMNDRMSFLEALSHSSLRFLFPVKSFPSPQVLGAIAPHTGGYDVSNEVELALVIPWLKEGDVLWSSSPFVWTPQEERLLYMDVGDPNLSVRGKGIKSLRLSTDFLGTPPSRFGVSLESRGWLDPSVRAVHCHHPGEHSSSALFRRLVGTLAEVLRDAPHVESVNLGGGFFRFSQSEMHEAASLASAAFPGRAIFLEPGRWIAKDAGACLGRVLAVGEKNGGLVVTTTISRDCHMKWPNETYSVRLIPMGGASRRAPTALLAGPTCDETDRLCEIPAKDGVAVGDVIAVCGVSGYSFGWNHSFNGVPAADVIMVN